MTHLSWFPLEPDEWARVVGAVAVEQEGALFRCACYAWQNPRVPCAIENEASAWERILGGRWRMLLPFLLRFFAPHPEQSGYVQWPWLLSLYETQKARYLSAADRGKKGGRPRKAASGEPAASKASTKAEGKADEKPSFRSAKAETNQAPLARILESDLSPSEREITSAGPSSVGRGGATSAGPAETPDVPEAQRPHFEQPGRGRSNAPAAETSTHALAEAWEAADPTRKAVVDAELATALAGEGMPQDDISRRLLRTSALLRVYQRATREAVA